MRKMEGKVKMKLDKYYQEGGNDEEEGYFPEFLTTATGQLFSA